MENHPFDVMPGTLALSAMLAMLGIAALTAPCEGGPPFALSDQQRNFTAEKRYLHLPVKNGGTVHDLSLLVDGKPFRSFKIELAAGEPDWWADLDLSSVRGKKISILVDGVPLALTPSTSVEQSDEPIGASKTYHERLRPQFHFSPRRGWAANPVGLVHYDGRFHLFFQHNPYGMRRENTHWGHAASDDLVHWQELPIALYPDDNGFCLSGSGLVDPMNQSGLRAGGRKLLILLYTSASRGLVQSLAYSTDGGYAWNRYQNNPVLPNITTRNRDPKVFWHEPTRRWIMLLFLDGDAGQKVYALFASPDLKRWVWLSELPLPEADECPDFFELPVDGDPVETRWVLWAGAGHHWIGRFNGRAFQPESGPRRVAGGGFYYAARTFGEVPAADGRRIQIGWMAAGQYPGMPFSQQMSFPRELTLRRTPTGLRLFCNPARDIARLHRAAHEWSELPLTPGENPLKDVRGELLHLRAEIDTGDADEVGFDLRGVKIQYRVRERRLSCGNGFVAFPRFDGPLQLEILLDRTSLEIFAADGLANLNYCFVPEDTQRGIAAYSQGGAATLRSLRIWELASIWE